MFLKLLDGSEVDLSVSQKFMNFSEMPYSMSKLIVNQFNEGIHFPTINKARTALDIGGNVGLFSIYISPFFEKVVMLEPTPEHIEIAQDLFEKLNITNIEIVDKAYWPYDKQVAFNIGQRNSTMNSIDSCPQVQTDMITVGCTTFKELFTEYPDVDFVKMDIEGAENEAYRHPDFEYLKCVDRFLIEVHSFPDLKIENIRKNLKKIKDRLESWGMKCMLDDRDQLYMSGIKSYENQSS